MPPRKAKEDASATETHTVTTRVHDATPEQDPIKKGQSVGITQAQKQILIDNLQQEITDRARKLRGQYALQAQSLRTRLEMRVNRIPMALRKRKMQDLMDEFAGKKDAAKPTALAPIQEKKVEEMQIKERKRQSDQISTASDDKENEDTQDLAPPKKRARPMASTAASATANTARPVARKAVLSPRSHNSRTLPRSPFKAAERSIAQVTRPASPAKTQAAKTTATRTATRPQQQQRNATNSDDGGRTSEASTTSASTTIVTKTTAASKGKTWAGKKAATAANAVKAATTGKRTAAATKKENVPPAGGRSLRKRA